MKFSTREDVDAPIADVFKALCDFDAFERAAMRRGAEVNRKVEPEGSGLGAKWDVAFVMRGKAREITLEVTDAREPEFLTVSMTSKSFLGSLGVELIALSRSKTRMVIGFEVRPQNLSARVLVQSAKLTKPKLDAKFRDRVALQVRDMESRLQAGV